MTTLKQLREGAFLAQRDVAEKMGVSLATVSLWERGEKKPRITRQRQLADLLGVTPQEVHEVVEENFKGKKEATGR